MSEGPPDAPTAVALQIVEDAMRVTWYWTLIEIEVEEHEGCQGPDCSCWKKEKRE